MSSTLRIVQVVHGLPPQERAGTEILTLELSRALQARGHHVTIIARTSAPERQECSLQEEQDAHGPQIIRIVNNYTRTAALFRLHYANPFFHETFRQLLHRQRADIVHFQHVAHLSASLIPSMSTLGYPLVLSLHDFFFACHLVHLMNSAGQLCPGPQRGERCITCLRDVASAEAVRHRFAFMTQVLQVPRRVIVPSAFLARRMTDEFPFLHDRLQVIAPGLPLPPGSARSEKNSVPAAPVASPSPGQPLRLVSIGALLPYKGAHVLIDALKGLPADRVQASWYGIEVASRQTYAEELRQAAAGLNVSWRGTYDRAELRAILAAHDVLVIPSICEETFSLVVREALQAGLPVIASRRGALPEVVEDGRNGLLFEPENAADLRCCLQRLLDEPALLARLTPHQFAWHDAAAYAGEVEQTYEAVLRQGGAPTAPVPAHPRASDQVSTTVRLAELACPPRDTPADEAGPGPGGPRPSDQAAASADPAALPRCIRDTPPAAAPPRVSVCLPTYNGEAYVAEAVRSVLAQSYPAFEIVAVDDGSSDRTLEMLQAFADPRVRIYQNPHRRGIPGNWNAAVALARGAYVCVFHQDDVMRADNLARKVALFDADPSLSLVHSRAERIIEDGAPTQLGDWMEKAQTDFVEEGEVYFRRLLLRGNCICAPSVVVRREQLAALGGFRETLGYACDYEMWMKLCVEGRVGFLNDILVDYRWHAGNASHHYQYERGVEECGQAMRAAVAYYTQRHGKTPQARLLAEAAEAVVGQQQWTAVLNRGKRWAEDQQTSWRSVAETQKDLIRELKDWIEELETGKTWLEEQRTNWEHIARQREEQTEHWQTQTRHWQESFWGRLGTWLKLVKPVREFPAEAEDND